MNEAADAVDPEAVLRGIGIKTVETVNPLELDRAVETVKRVADEPGFKAIIFRYPCIVKYRPKGKRAAVDTDRYVGCRRCVTELGCPALLFADGKAKIDETLCTGCTLCEQICPVHAIGGGEARDPDRITAAYRDGGAKKETPAPAVIAEKGPAVRKDIVLCGVGGQGTVLASRILAAAAMRAGLPVRTAETIGMAQRGGSVFSCLRIGDGIHAPLIGPGEADLILGFEPAEAVRMLPYLKEGGTVVTSIRPVVPVSAMIGGTPYDPAAMLDFLAKRAGTLVTVDGDRALAEIGSDKVMNVLLLGIAAETGALGFERDALLDALKTVLPPKLHEINQKALYYKA